MNRVEGADELDIAVVRLENRNAEIEGQEDSITVAVTNDTVACRARKNPKPFSDHALLGKRRSDEVARGILPDSSDVSGSGTEAVRKDRDVEATAPREHLAGGVIAINDVVSYGNDSCHDLLFPRMYAQ
jgi:hypothetical protein